MVMAYDVSATYSLERNKEFAPSQIGQFTTFGEFTEEHLNELFAEVEKDIEHLPLAERTAKRYYLRGIRNRLLNEGGNPNPKCVALSAHMRLFPNGDVPTCQFSSKVVGNLREQKFEDVWFGEKIKGQRDWVNNCPGCWAECEVIPNALYTGDLIRETFLPRGDRKVVAQNTTPEEVV
jgi:MoaA/NifB/PqqE/SkfB family radical SAM enzyme